jgi:hypothetical protein
MRRYAVVALFLAAASADAQTMQPGEWEFTSTLSSPILPQPQVSTINECISEADAKDPTRFSGRDQAQGCTVTPGARGADSFSWTLSCPQQGMTGTGRISFGPGMIVSDVRMTVAAQGQTMEMQSRTTGRRLGPCKPK